MSGRDDDSFSSPAHPPASSLFAWGFIALVLLMLTPVGMTPGAHRLLAVTAIMVVLWMNQALPIAITSLLPRILYPMLGIRPLDEVSRAYLDPTVFLFLGGFFLAMEIERWGCIAAWPCTL